MSGRFLIGVYSHLQLEDINKNEMFCSFHSTLNYRVIGDINNPDALDPSGGPFIEKGNFHINEWDLRNITWDKENKVYLLMFSNGK